MDREFKKTQKGEGSKLFGHGIRRKKEDILFGPRADAVYTDGVHTESADSVKGPFGLLGAFKGLVLKIKGLYNEKTKNILKTGTVFLFTLTVSGASPMTAVYPFGIALVCAMSRAHYAFAALGGALLSLFFIEEAPLLYGAALISVFFIRLALGGLGIVKTERFYSEKGVEASIRDSPFSKGNAVKAKLLFSVKNAFSTTAGVKMLCALGGAVTVGFAMLLEKGNLWYDVFAASFSVVVMPLFTFAFSVAADKKYRPGVRKAGAASLAFAFFLAISPLTLGGMNVSAVLAFLLAMCVSVSLGVSDGILFGLFSGMAMEPAFAPMYAIGAAATGALWGYSAGAATVCGAVLGISWALYADGVSAFSSAMPEILLAAGIFYTLSSLGLIPEKKELFKTDAAREFYDLHKEEKLCLKNRGDAAERINRICGAMSHMAKVFSGLSERLRVPSSFDCDTICDGAFSEACKGCGKKIICHAREKFKDGRLLRLISNSLKVQGRVSIDSFPETMQRGCPNVDKICGEINRLYREFYESVLKSDKTAVIAEDYDMLSQLIKSTVCEKDPEGEKNEELTKKLTDTFRDFGISGERISVYGIERPRVFVRGLDVSDLSFGSEDIGKMVEECTGAAMTHPLLSIDYDKLNLYMERKKSLSFKHGHFSERAGGLEMNGDAVSAFSMPEDRFSMLICDGMGSGRDAALTARVSAIFLERMLSAGCPADTALKLLNNFTRERRIECFSTVDLFIADPYTGKAEFIKSGAAPSFVLRGNKLFRMECESAPVGILKQVRAASVSFTLQKGDYVIMISDGILPGEENSAWLYDILVNSGGRFKTPADGAKEILRAAREQSGILRPDDATVGIIRVDAA